MKIFIFNILIFFSILSLTLGATTDTLANEVHEVHSKWLQTFSSIPEVAYSLGMGPVPAFSSALDSGQQLEILVNKSTISNGIAYSESLRKCSDDLIQILYNLDSGWALKMLDSNGKLMSGVLGGSVTWPGDYKQCLEVYAPEDELNHGNFRGRYCTASWSLNISKSFPNLPISTGACVPDSCGGEEVKNATLNFFQLIDYVPLVEKLLSRLTLKSVTCKTGAPPLDSWTIFYLFIFFVFVVLAICASSLTVYEYYAKASTEIPYGEISEPLSCTSHKKYGSAEAKAETTEQHEVAINDGQPDGTDAKEPTKVGESNMIRNLIQCFCAFTNGAKILKVQVSDKQWQSVHGIRFLSMTWVVIGHTYIIGANYISNKLDTLKAIDGFPFQMLMNSPFSVDSFFLLSGLLLGYLLLKEMDRKSGKVNWVYFYIHRFWRLTPVYMLLVGFYMLVFRYMGSGPFWNDDYGDTCRHTWWKYLLYINNFIPIHDMCIGWSWYLANDMQFYLVSPLFVYPLWRWPKIGLSIISVLMIGSWTATAVLTYKFDIIPMLAGVTDVTDLQAYQDKMWNSFDIIYDKPYCRIAPYLVGILLGYALYKTGDCRTFLSWKQQVLGWLLATFCSASVIFGLYHVHMYPALSIAYNTFSRTSFVLGLSWMIYACETGHGGVLHKFLSWKVWVPLSRLTYCAYLVHPMLVHGYYMSLKTTLYFTHLTVILIFLGILVIAYTLAFAVSVIFESPMMNLEKILLTRWRSRTN